MGANMARRLKEKGFVITAVQDRHPPAAESLAKELSCEVAASPARVAEISDVVLTVVTNDVAMDEIEGIFARGLAEFFYQRLQAIVLGHQHLRDFARAFDIGFGRDVDHVSQ